MGRIGSGSGIQFGGSPWAKKMIVLRTEISGLWLFDDLFICVLYVWLMEYYMRNWAFCVALT